MNPLERAKLHNIALRWNNGAREFHPCALEKLSLHPMDLGILHGAIVVERLRTFGGNLPDWRPHWERFQSGCQALGIPISYSVSIFGNAILQLLDRNRIWIDMEPDVSLIVVATPGNPDVGLGECSMYMHLQQIPWSRLRSWYRHGSSLVSSQYATGAGSCWPSPIKVRNRLSYYLADRDAKISNCSESNRSERLGLLRTSSGMVADTSVANVIVIDDRGNWVSPKPDTVMLGTSLRYCESLIADQSTSISYRDICFDELKTAQEVILVGNSGCAWHVSEIDGYPIGDRHAGPQCRRLQALWCQRLTFDWLTQGLTAFT